MILWTSRDAELATGGRSTKPWQASGVSIDTRSLEEGDLFIALRDKRDGHDFVADAFAAGASAAVVSRIPEGIPGDAPLLVVGDVQDALVGLGTAGRNRSSAKFVAVTGSVGKTSTKEMLRHVLKGQGKTSAGEQSFNNHWGVPITLARVPHDAAFAVVEIGMNNPGEIRPLAKLAQPDAATITRIGPVHLAAFSSVDDIAEEKSSIFSGLQSGGTAVINADSPGFEIMKRAASASGARAVTFGRSDTADWKLLDVRLSENGTILSAENRGRVQYVKIAAAGQHFAENALGVLATVAAVGGDPVLAAIDLGTWLPPAGRGTRHKVVLSSNEEQELTVIDDAFNASPVSLEAALEVLAGTNPGQTTLGRPGRRVAILGDMLELGEREGDFHAGIARLAAVESVEVLHCAGKLMRCLYEALPSEKRGRWYATSEEMASKAHELARPGDVVLVKGSKGSRVSVVVDAIKKLGEVHHVDS